jgi:hypothetical protein
LEDVLVGFRSLLNAGNNLSENMASQPRRQIFSHNYENLGLSERKRLGDLSRWEDNIKMDIKEIVYKSMRVWTGFIRFIIKSSSGLLWTY